MSFFPSTNLIPLKLAVRFDPPTLALFYKINQKDKKKRRYNIFLNQLAFLPNVQEITEQLFCEHSAFLNDKYVQYDQVQKMVQLIYDNKNVTEQQVSPQNMPDQNFTQINQMNEVNSYIESDNEINKSIEFENDEELYYSSYNPKASTSNQRLSNSKRFNQEEPQERLDTSNIQKSQRVYSSYSPNRYPKQTPQTTNPPNDSDLFDFSSPTQTYNAPNQNIWNPKGNNNLANKDLSLSISGMQQFMDQRNSGQKILLPNKPAFKNTVKQPQPQVQPFSMPSINSNSQTTQQDNPQPIITNNDLSPNLSMNYQSNPINQNLNLNFNNLNNRQKQQLYQNAQRTDNENLENNLNIANFVEEGNLQGQMFIDDQLYQSPVPSKRQTGGKFVQQQINQNQQYYLQQHNTQNKNIKSSNNGGNIQVKNVINNQQQIPQQYQPPQKQSKVGFLKNIQNMRNTNYQEIQQYG